MVIAGAAAILALLVSRWLIRTIVTLAPAGLRRLSTVSIGWFESLAPAGVILVVVLLLAGGGLAAGGRRRSGIVFDEGAASTMSRSSLRVRAWLLSGQQAVVLALLAAAGLMMSTLWSLAHQPLGFQPENVWLAAFSISREYPDDQARYQALIDRIRDNVQEIGQQRVAVAFDAPLEGHLYDQVELQNGERLVVVGNRVTNGYFDVLGIPFVAGRDFQRTDSPDGVVIVNRAFAAQYLGGTASALGLP